VHPGKMDELLYVYIYGKNPKMVSEIIQVSHIF
jgi:hypothetical protein